VSGAAPGAPVRLVLASASPRRLDLLRSAGFDPEVRPADLDESVRPGEDPAGYVVRLAVGKARAVARPGEVVLGADTAVVLGAAILGKPADLDDARRMLRALAGRTHLVCTGVAVVVAGVARSAVVTTEVAFGPVPDDALEAWLAAGEALDKAGGYGVQGVAGAFGVGVRGSLTNVIGLPLEVAVPLVALAVGGAVC